VARDSSIGKRRGPILRLCSHSRDVWMHSHSGMQEQVLMTAPLIVEDEIALHEDRQEIVLMLHDFTFRSPEQVLASLIHPNATWSCQCARVLAWPE